MADRLDVVRAAVPAAVGRGHGVDADDAHRAPLLERRAGARQRAAGADAGDEAGHAAAGLLPDLGRGGVVVGPGVRGVAVLVGEPAAGRLLRDPCRQVDDVARVVAGQSARRQHHLGAVGAQRGDLLGGRGVGDDDERAVAEEPADQREADPGVARGALDDHPARAQRPGALGGADHPQRRPVLDAPAGVLPLGLDVDPPAPGPRSPAAGGSAGWRRWRRAPIRGRSRARPVCTRKDGPVTFPGFGEAVVDFYEGLEADNSKAYWTDNKALYDDHVRAPMVAMLADLEPEFGPGKVFRPYRDVRFAADKTPYKVQCGATVGGRYVQVSADGIMVAVGYYRMTSAQVARFRAAIDDDRHGPELEKIVDGPARRRVHGRRRAAQVPPARRRPRAPPPGAAAPQEPVRPALVAAVRRAAHARRARAGGRDLAAPRAPRTLARRARRRRPRRHRRPPGPPPLTLTATTRAAA